MAENMQCPSPSITRMSKPAAAFSASPRLVAGPASPKSPDESDDSSISIATAAACCFACALFPRLRLRRVRGDGWVRALAPNNTLSRPQKPRRRLGALVRGVTMFTAGEAFGRGTWATATLKRTVVNLIATARSTTGVHVRRRTRKDALPVCFLHAWLSSDSTRNLTVSRKCQFSMQIFLLTCPERWPARVTVTPSIRVNAGPIIRPTPSDGLPPRLVWF